MQDPAKISLRHPKCYDHNKNKNDNDINDDYITVISPCKLTQETIFSGGSKLLLLRAQCT